MIDKDFRSCDAPGCVRRMRKVRTGQGGITLTREQMLEGYGGAEECQQCHSVQCDACYPNRDNVCVRCGQRTLRLVMVHYEVGTTALWPQQPPLATTNRPRGAPWAIELRRYLATQEPNRLEAAASELISELSRLPPSKVRFSWFTTGSERKGIQSVLEIARELRNEDRSRAANDSRRVARLLKRCGRTDDATSILLIASDWEVRVGQSYLMAPPAMQDQILDAGLKACRRCAEIARSLDDTFCEAEYLTRLGNGLYSSRKLDEAEKAFTDALDLWRSLACERTEFVTKVGRGLQHLGTVFNSRGLYTKSSAAYREAVDLLEGVPDGQRDLAFTLNNLGNLHLHRREYEHARSLFEKAFRILEVLIDGGTERSTEDPHSPLLKIQLPRIRGNLALCLSEIGDLDGSERAILQTIQEQQQQLYQGGSQVRMQLAHSYSTLGRVRLQRWINSKQAEGVAHEELLSDAIANLKAAVGVYKEHLGHSLASAHLPKIVDAMTSFGLGLAYQKDFLTASSALDEACALAQSSSLWFEGMRAFDARRELEVIRKGEPLAGYEHALSAVQTAETGMARLGEAERVNRDLVKARIELSYLSCIANLAKNGEQDKLFHMLEALRRIDRLVQGDHIPQVLGSDLESARRLAARRRFNYVASQAAPGGTVFLTIDQYGTATSEVAVAGWADRAFRFSQEIDLSARTMEVFGGPSLRVLTDRAKQLFEELPVTARAALTDDSVPIFLSLGGDQHNLPIELLFTNHGWLGLQRIYARVRSFEEVETVIERQPLLQTPLAVVAAGPGDQWGKIAKTAQSVATSLVSSGFALHPAGEILIENNVQRWTLLDSIDRKPSMVLFIGHGGVDQTGAFLLLSDAERLRPSDLGQIRFDAAPLVHLECCMAGQALYHGGGYWDSYAVSLIAIGASACLVGNRIVFGTASEILCHELYSRLTGPRAASVGTALLEARRAVAKVDPNPLLWVAPVLYGNPNVRLQELN